MKVRPADLDRLARLGAVVGPPPQLPPALDCSEAEFQAWVVRQAQARGWRHYHTHDSRRSPEGFPDLVMVRDRTVYAELKTTTGVVSQDQREWLEALEAAGDEVYLWRPADWRVVIETLTRRGLTLPLVDQAGEGS